MAERVDIDVCADWVGLSGPTLMGTLYATPARGEDVFSFEYDHAWLESGRGRELDPQLQLVRGPQYATSKQNFGVFLDSSPDRWGRRLLERREAHEARTAGRRPRSLREVDYLLGVFDGHRMGALRFRRAGRFLDDNPELASPPWTSLRELEQASLSLEKANAEKQADYGRWLKMLLAPGKSLGGARPKASVLDPAKGQWIAKFPSSTDEDDIGAWEWVAHTLAAAAGITVPEFQRKKLGSKHHAFLSKRFDRSSKGRIHFASAMTLLERSDGDTDTSYLHIAELLARRGAHAARDLEQLWRRIVFNVCISNVDDHLRNHGFILERDGWALSPAYDMNPVAYGEGLSLNISTTDNAQSLELVNEVAATFRVTAARAKKVIAEVRAVIRTWPATAAKAGISRSERDRMENAFRLASD